MGAVDVRVPRVSDVPAEVAPEGVQSEILQRYERRSQTQKRLLCRPYGPDPVNWSTFYEGSAMVVRQLRAKAAGAM
jgi:hypothetical protein